MPAPTAVSTARVTDDLLLAGMTKLTVEEAVPKKPVSRKFEPANFFVQQSSRSTFLAGKTKTAKLSRKQNDLFDDLLALSTVNTERAEQKEDAVVDAAGDVVVKNPDERGPDDEDDEEEEEIADFLLLRGAVTRKKNNTADHPFAKKTIVKTRFVPKSNIGGTKEVIEYASYSATGGGYECGANEWQDHNNPCEGRSSVITRVGAPMTGFLLTPDSSPEEPRSTRKESPESSSASPKADDEIPDTLVDFIMEYTRMALTPRPESASPSSRSTDASPASPSVDENPYKPYSSLSEVIEASLIALGLSPSALKFETPKNRPAKARLRAKIGDAKIEKAMRDLCECIADCTDLFEMKGLKSDIQNFEVLFWGDICEGMSLLHRALLGNARELAQGYVVIEQQLLQPRAHFKFGLPWDQKNTYGESPLWLAVHTMKPLFVDYLLELSADPNARTTKDREDTVLHEASRRGMTSIVKSLIADPRCDIEATNKLGDTPLYTAVKYNNGIYTSTGLRTSNEEVAEALLKAKADPTHVDKVGNTIFHYAASYVDTPMLELFAKLIPDEISTPLANAKNNHGKRPMDYLLMLEGEIEEERYAKCFYALLTCNGEVKEERADSEGARK